MSESLGLTSHKSSCNCTGCGLEWTAPPHDQGPPSAFRGTEAEDTHDPKIPASGHVHFAGRRQCDDGSTALLARRPGSVTGGGGRWLISPASICPK